MLWLSVGAKRVWRASRLRVLVGDDQSHDQLGGRRRRLLNLGADHRWVGGGTSSGTRRERSDREARATRRRIGIARVWRDADRIDPLELHAHRGRGRESLSMGIGQG